MSEEIKVGMPEWQCNYHKGELARLEKLNPEPGFEREAVHWHKMFHEQSVKMWEHLREVFALRKLLLQFDVSVPEMVEEIEAMTCSDITKHGRYFTDTELARLVAVACREHRYACVDSVKQDPGCYASGKDESSAIQNAPAPTLEHVMKKYEELK